MKRLTLSISLAFISLAMTLPVMAKYHEPDNTSRVLWDISSKKVIFEAGNYARIIPLTDGRLMAVAESGGGISVCYSSNDGDSWTTPERIIQNPSGVNYAVPDLIQLSDGTILVGFNPRPHEPYSEDRKFGIRTLRSTDGGKSWEGPFYVFDASHLFTDGCWEPSFLEIPETGEIHCYFANEYPFQQSNEQEISVSRSFDGGKTWSSPERVCFRAGHRDGMPSAIITDAGEIVVIVEDNGYDRGFHATTMRCTLEQNWHDCWVDKDSPNRHVIFADNDTENMKYISAAPYIRKLKSGETIASWQGDHWGRAGGGAESTLDMFVAVGDADARNFTQISQPFNTPENSHSLWNSINVGNNNDIFALGSIGSPNSGNVINLMKGYALNHISAAYGTPVIDGTPAKDDWTCKNGAQVFLGANSTKNRASADFLYDNDALYFYVRVVDRDIYTDKIDNDGVYLYLDTKNCCDTYPQDGEFRIFLNVDGSVQWSYGNNGRWTTAENLPEGVKLVANPSKTYYQLEAAIRWSALGLDGPVSDDTVMRANIEIRDRREGELVTETIPQTAKNASWTWMELRLEKNNESGGMVDITADHSKEPKIIINGSNVSVTSNVSLSKVELFAPDGRMVLSRNVIDTNIFSVDIDCPGLYILHTLTCDGQSKSAKIVIH